MPTSLTVKRSKRQSGQRLFSCPMASPSLAQIHRPPERPLEIKSPAQIETVSRWRRPGAGLPLISTAGCPLPAPPDDCPIPHLGSLQPGSSMPHTCCSLLADSQTFQPHSGLTPKPAWHLTCTPTWVDFALVLLRVV